MAKSQMHGVVAHWHRLIENFDTSAVGFYEAVEAALRRRKIPGVKTSYLRTSQGGILTPDREYLRVTGEHHVFDLCAAPFGTGYFFSSWVTTKQARHVGLYLLGITVLTFGITWLLEPALGAISLRVGPGQLGSLLWLVKPVLGPVMLLGSFMVVLWLIAMGARQGHFGPEAAILAVPLVGSVYERIFAPLTYYRIDTMLMFQAAVHSAMLEVIEGLMVQKGLRALTDTERRPVSRELVGAVESPFAAMSDGATSPARLA
jgi:hypothetical protein